MESPATTTQRWARTARSAAASCRLAPHRSASADHCQLSRAPTPHVARLGGPGQLRGAQRRQWSTNKVTAEVQAPRVDAHYPAELRQLPPGRRPARPVARVEQRGAVVAILELKGPPLGPAQRLRCVARGPLPAQAYKEGRGEPALVCVHAQPYSVRQKHHHAEAHAHGQHDARPGMVAQREHPPHECRIGRAPGWAYCWAYRWTGRPDSLGQVGRPSAAWKNSGANLQPAAAGTRVH